MVHGYKKFNENYRDKNRKGRFRQTSWMDEPPTKNKYATKRVEVSGIEMEYSNNFKFLLTKIASKGNPIAKELLAAVDKPDSKFEISYLDLTKKDDMVSFLGKADKNITDKYSSNKRQLSKAYKAIKVIFGSKFTQAEVTKFVSMYKQYYNQGPDKPRPKQKQTKDELLKKIIQDIKSGKMKWSMVVRSGNMEKYECKVQITDKKYIAFDYFYFFQGDKMNFMTLNFRNEMEKDLTKKSIWIDTYKNEELEQADFIKLFREKFIVKDEE